MAANFAWGEANGAAYNTNVTTPTDVNWKSVADSTTAYTSAPITAGNNSYVKYQFGILSGTWNQILNGKWSHTATTTSVAQDIDGTIIKIIGAPTGASQLTYAAPIATDAAAFLTVDMSGITAIGSGTPVYFGITSPNQASKSASVVVGGGSTVYTNYLATQLKTTGSAVAGDIETATVTLSFDEN